MIIIRPTIQNVANSKKHPGFPRMEACRIGNRRPMRQVKNQLMSVVMVSADEGSISAMYSHTMGPRLIPKAKT